MKKLMGNVKAAASIELAEANKNWPAFRSCHEGFGVITEEMVEAMTEIDDCATYMDAMRKDLSVHNGTDRRVMLEFANAALRAACEMIQVSAMCVKYVNSMAEWPKQEEKDA